MKFLTLLILLASQSFATTYKDIRPIIDAKCAVCHNESVPQMNWQDYKTAVEKKDKIKTRLSDKTMPPANITELTEDERAKMIKWVNEGAKP